MTIFSLQYHWKSYRGHVEGIQYNWFSKGLCETVQADCFAKRLYCWIFFISAVNEVCGVILSSHSLGMDPWDSLALRVLSSLSGGFSLRKVALLFLDLRLFRLYVSSLFGIVLWARNRDLGEFRLQFQRYLCSCLQNGCTGS